MAKGVALDFLPVAPVTDVQTFLQTFNVQQRRLLQHAAAFED